jgi:nucleoside-diphosphate-sugar epimerase
MKKILLTGITGFLGSHIAEELVNQEYSIMGLIRESSNIWRCKSFKDKVRWIKCDNLSEAESAIVDFKPEILVHAAWNGVKAYDRDNWQEQLKNLFFLVSLLEISKKAGIKKVLALGTQAEYGIFNGVVDENRVCNPYSAYGAAKLCASVLLRTFAEQNSFDWYWLRIFSVFGPREEKNWLIPSAINNLLENKEMALTPCEQKYDYLFTRDFVYGILRVIKCNGNKSGVYNLASGESIKLKEILEFLEQRLSPDKKLLKFGALSYRQGQVMNMQSNSNLFYNTFGFRPVYTVFDGLEETMNFYINPRNDDDGK